MATAGADGVFGQATPFTMPLPGQNTQSDPARYTDEGQYMYHRHLQPLQFKASSLGGVGGPFASMPGTAGTPLPLLAYGGPTSNDQVAIRVKQPILATDPLRTGTYSKTLTFTLSTTTP